MIKYVPVSTLEDADFPYDFTHWDYPLDLLRSCLYSAWWDTMDIDGEEHVIVMDYDGFIEWYNAHVPEWMEQEEDDGIKWDEYPAEEYLPYHIGRTIDVVKEVRK